MEARSLADTQGNSGEIKKLPGFLFTHPFGNPNSTEALQALCDAGVQQTLVTSIDLRAQSVLGTCISCLPTRLEALVARRNWIPPEVSDVRSYPWPELKRMALVKSGLQKLLSLRYRTLVDDVCLSVDTFASKLLKELPVSAVYGYEDMCARQFQSAKDLGYWCVYELTSLYYHCYHERIKEELTLYPDLVASVPALDEPEEKLQRKEQELEHADLIIVPSRVVKESLSKASIDSSRIHVLPYGAMPCVPEGQREKKEGCRVLYAGQQSLSKGVHRLLEAFSSCHYDGMELRLCGHKALPQSLYDAAGERVINRGPVSRIELQKEYQQASVLVLPTLSDSFGLVVVEAMAHGVPVIVTTAAGSSELIESGVDGLCIPAQDTEAITDALVWCYEHPDELYEMGLRAREKVQAYSWNRYRESLVSLLQSEYAKLNR